MVNPMESHLTSTHTGPLAFPSEHDVLRLVDHSRSDNTHRTYDVGVRSWARFASTYSYQVFPADPAEVALWLSALFDEGKSTATAKTYLQSLRDHHRERGSSALNDIEGLRRVMQGIQRLNRERDARKARALSPTELMMLVGQSRMSGTLRGTRDTAWWLLCTSLGLRYSDAAILERRDIRFVEEKGAVVTLRFSKTDQFARGTDLALARARFAHVDPVMALTDLLKALPEDPHTPVFQSVLKSNRWSGRSLTNTGLNKAIRRLADDTGINGERLTAHSARVTFATNAYAAGIDESAIAITGRWKSLSVQRSYRRVDDESLFDKRSTASHWLEETLSR